MTAENIYQLMLPLKFVVIMAHMMILENCTTNTIQKLSVQCPLKNRN